MPHILFNFDESQNQWVPQRHHPQDAMMTIDELHKQAEEEELGVCVHVLCMSTYLYVL